MATKFTDESLVELGLGTMPAADRASLVLAVNEELEYRVGSTLSEGLAEEQLDLFERFLEGDAAAARAWLDEHRPNWARAAGFLRLRARLDDDGAVAEWASIAWVDVMRPDHEQIVGRTVERMRQEITGYRDRLLAATVPRGR